MTDPTEDIRKQMLVEINAAPGSREYLEHKHGQVWDTGQLSEDFEVIGFMAPVVVVRAQVRRAEREPHVPALAEVLLRLRAVPTVTPPTGQAGTPARSIPENPWFTQCFAPIGSLGDPDMPENPSNDMISKWKGEITQGSTRRPDRPPGPAGGAGL